MTTLTTTSKGCSVPIRGIKEVSLSLGVRGVENCSVVRRLLRDMENSGHELGEAGRDKESTRGPGAYSMFKGPADRPTLSQEAQQCVSCRYVGLCAHMCMCVLIWRHWLLPTLHDTRL